MRYVYEKVYYPLRIYLEIIPHNTAAGLEEIYRRNARAYRVTNVRVLKMWRLNFIRKRQEKYACARTGVPLRRSGKKRCPKFGIRKIYAE